MHDLYIGAATDPAKVTTHYGINCLGSTKLNVFEGSVDLTTTPPKLKVYSQDAEPALTANQVAIWVDTDDSNRTYLIVHNGAAQKKVELT